jgi:hypothetical protein
MARRSIRDLMQAEVLEGVQDPASAHRRSIPPPSPSKCYGRGKGGGLVDAPDARIVRKKGKYPLRAAYRPLGTAHLSWPTGLLLLRRLPEHCSRSRRSRSSDHPSSLQRMWVYLTPCCQDRRHAPTVRPPLACPPRSPSTVTTSRTARIPLAILAGWRHGIRRAGLLAAASVERYGFQHEATRDLALSDQPR